MPGLLRARPAGEPAAVVGAAVYGEQVGAMARIGGGGTARIGPGAAVRGRTPV